MQHGHVQPHITSCSYQARGHVSIRLSPLIKYKKRKTLLPYESKQQLSIVTDYGMDDSGPNPGAARISLRHRVQIGSGAHPVSYPIDRDVNAPRG